MSVRALTKTISHGGYVMKGKECNSQESLHKLARLGIGLATATALGSLVTTHSPLLGSVVVEAQEVTDQVSTEQVSPSQEVQEVPDQTNTEQVSPVNQEAKTATFIILGGYYWYDKERIENKVTLHSGESYTFSVDESKYVIPPNQQLTYSYDEIENGRYYYLSLEPKAQVNEDQSVTFEVRAEQVSIEKGGDNITHYPIQTKKVTLMAGESYTPGTPVFEGYETADYHHPFKNAPFTIAPTEIVNDGKSTIVGRYLAGWYQKTYERNLPTIPADYTGELIAGEAEWYQLRVGHRINGQFRQSDIFRVPANTSLAPALFANPNYGQMTGYETQHLGSNKSLIFNYTYPEDQLPDGSIYKLPAVRGVWNDKIIPAPNSNTTDTPTTPTEEPKQPEIPTPEDKQAKDLTSGDSAVSVRVFGSDVTAVDKIIANKETDSAVLATLPAGYTAQDADLYDIKTLDTTGQFVQIGGEAQVTLPVAPDRVVEKVIYFLPSTGAVEELPFEWDKATNTVFFKVSHFSHYGIIYQPVSNSNPNPTPPAGQVTPNSQTKPASPQVPPTVTPQNLTVTPVTPQATSQTLPKTGEAGSLISIVGLTLASLALALRPRRQKR